MKLGLLFAAAITGIGMAGCSIFGGGQAISPTTQARVSLVVMASAESAVIRACTGSIRSTAASGDEAGAHKLLDACNKYVIPVAYAIEAIAQDVDTASTLSSGDTTYNKLTCVAYSAVENWTEVGKILSSEGFVLPQEVNDAITFVAGFAGATSAAACDPSNPNNSVPADAPIRDAGTAPASSSPQVGTSL